MDSYAKFVMTDPVGDAWPRGEESCNVSLDARIAGEDREAAERRRADRHSVAVHGRVRELGSQGCEAKVLNISATGFMAQSAAEFVIGARVWLILPGRDRANAVVRWCDGDRIGAEFAAPIDTTGLLAR